MKYEKTAANVQYKFTITKNGGRFTILSRYEKSTPTCTKELFEWRLRTKSWTSIGLRMEHFMYSRVCEEKSVNTDLL